MGTNSPFGLPPAPEALSGAVPIRDPRGASCEIDGGDGRGELEHQISQIGRHTDLVAFTLKLLPLTEPSLSSHLILEVFVMGVKAVGPTGEQWRIEGVTKNGNLTFKASYNTTTRKGRITLDGPLHLALNDPAAVAHALAAGSAAVRASVKPI